ncbi:MAG TPA: hypothetical protein VGC36_12420, partial [Rhizomicrobium sp.]
LGLLAIPIPEHHQGGFVKIASLLAMGGWVGLRSIFGALGAGAAVAGVWIGVVGFRWDQLALIGLGTPAVAIIVCTAMIIYFGWTLPQLNQARKSD